MKIIKWKEKKTSRVHESDARVARTTKGTVDAEIVLIQFCSRPEIALISFCSRLCLLLKIFFVIIC